MPIRVRFYGSLKELVGYELEVHARSPEIELSELVKVILESHPDLNRYIELSQGDVVVRGLNILVNGRHVVFLGGSKAKLKDGDVIDVLPPLHGGVIALELTIDIDKVYIGP